MLTILALLQAVSPAASGRGRRRDGRSTVGAITEAGATANCASNRALIRYKLKF